MCGILFSNSSSVNLKKFDDALKIMEHRGPEFSAVRIVDQNYFGHVRLKILDLDDRSNQPFYSSDGRYILVFNGEIYNYRELAKKYDLKLSTSCDTEVLVELYALIGSKVLIELLGMFSFIIYDKIKKNFFAARDRLGVKPLYYTYENGEYTFSSEVAPLLKLQNKNDFDPVGIRQYRKLRTFFNGHTLYKNINMFPAGHYLENGKFSRYWELDYSPKLPPEDDELRELIKSAVDYRCISDVPVGSFLSGGLDSTLVTALSRKITKKFYTWTVGFPDFNEFDFSDIAAEYLDTIHTKVIVEPSEFLKTASYMIKKRQEPLSVPNEVLLYLMTVKAKKENTVILSGEGADELFFGYDRIFKWASSNSWDLTQFDKYYSYGTNDDIDIITDAVSPFLKYENNIDTVASFFQISHLHGLLRRLDNSTMFSSVEARVPFVDHRLIERLAGVSIDYKMENGVVKLPLKRIYKNEIPLEVIERPKVGFPVKMDQVFEIQENQSYMDNWLLFNLQTLGVPEDILNNADFFKEEFNL